MVRREGGVCNRWRDCGLREGRDLIFSIVTQSSEPLVLADRLYDTVMLGSA